MIGSCNARPKLEMLIRSFDSSRVSFLMMLLTRGALVVVIDTSLVTSVTSRAHKSISNVVVVIVVTSLQASISRRKNESSLLNVKNRIAAEDEVGGHS